MHHFRFFYVEKLNFSLNKRILFKSLLCDHIIVDNVDEICTRWLSGTRVQEGVESCELEAGRIIFYPLQPIDD